MVKFLFVHGAAHGAWCWERLIPHVERPAIAIDLPGRGGAPGDLVSIMTDDWADAVVEEVDACADPVVLVGHSLAGVTMPRVADRVWSQLAHMVFIACSVPPEGMATLDVLSPEIRPIAAAAQKDAKASTLSEPIARKMFCNDMTEEQSRFVIDRLVPEAWGPLLEPTQLAGLSRGVPSTYVRLLKDAAVTPAVQDHMVETIRGCGPCEVVDLDAGHDVMVSQPEALAGILNEIASTQ
jgi:pimeloyl-ACP methyl ester carboxylesterase